MSNARPEYNLIKKWRGNPGSRVAAMRAKCFSCMGGTEEEVPPGITTDIRNCSSPDCPLHNFRPYKHR